MQSLKYLLRGPLWKSLPTPALGLKMTIRNDCYLYSASFFLFCFGLYYLCFNALDTLSFYFFLLVTDVPQIDLEKGEENEWISKDQIKKRKKKHKDYQPNYFLSIPITNKEVLFKKHTHNYFLL